MFILTRARHLHLWQQSIVYLQRCVRLHNLINATVIPTTVSPNNTFQAACWQRAPPAMGPSIIHEGPNNAVSWFTTFTLKVTCLSLLLALSHKHTRTHTVMLIDPNCTDFTSNPSCLNAGPSGWPVTEEAP